MGYASRSRLALQLTVFAANKALQACFAAMQKAGSVATGPRSAVHQVVCRLNMRFDSRTGLLAGVCTQQPQNAAATDSRQQPEHDLQGRVPDTVAQQHQGPSSSAQQKQLRPGNQALQSNADQLLPLDSPRSPAQPASLSQHLEMQRMHALHVPPPDLQQQQLVSQPSPPESHKQQPHTSWPKFEQQLRKQAQGIKQQGTGQQGNLGQQGFRQKATGQQGFGQCPTAADGLPLLSRSMSGLPTDSDVPSRSVSAELHAIQRQLLSQQLQKRGAEGIPRVVYHLSHLTNAKSRFCTLSKAGQAYVIKHCSWPLLILMCALDNSNDTHFYYNCPGEVLPR